MSYGPLTLMQRDRLEHASSVAGIFHLNVPVVIVQIAQDLLDVFLLDSRIEFGLSFD